MAHCPLISLTGAITSPVILNPEELLAEKSEEREVILDFKPALFQNTQTECSSCLHVNIGFSTQFS